MATVSDAMKSSDRPQFSQLPTFEANNIAKIHSANGFSIKATAAQLGMDYREFCQLVVRHANLRTAICRQKKLQGRYRPYGPKKGEV